jgi:hypothetical protein
VTPVRLTPRCPNRSSSGLSVGSNRADHLGTVELHRGPHPATVHFGRANHRDLFLHQLNQPDTAIGLAFGGKRPLRCEEAFAGQPPIVISRQFRNGIIPLPQPSLKPFLQSLGDEATPPENRQSSPVAALHQFWQDRAGMNESEKQFSFTRAALSTSGSSPRTPVTTSVWPVAFASGSTSATPSGPPPTPAVKPHPAHPSGNPLRKIL